MSGTPSAKGSERAWHALDTETIARALGTTTTGITDEQAARIRAELGANTVAERTEDGLFEAFLESLREPL